MRSEYWAIRRTDGSTLGGWYLAQHGSWDPERLHAMRFIVHARAESFARDLRHLGYSVRLVHVRIRPRSERLYLCARLAAWQPTIWAAQDEAQHGCTCAACREARVIPEEYRL